MNLDLSQTEENYLKAIFSLSIATSKAISTNAIAEKLETKASSVTDMIKKLSDKELVHYKKYQGASLTVAGKAIAVRIIRKHRLWEVFLVKHLNFKWDEVHDVAEQLEHIKSTKLTQQLDEYLEFPTHDPHGDPIPDENGNIDFHTGVMLSSILASEIAIIMGVKDSTSSFLKYLDSSGIKLGSVVEVLHKEEFDNSMLIQIEGQKLSISQQIAKNLYVKKQR
ncbi:metal-dependent transcriptional regulator [Flavicella sediminum]|uniref:metal-dependent transcriptional regulator n=1 Tax=Flavicella sediminum TaxID=2585141 RepID=UPI00112169CD|nr:metal-dependent transcriptional regulator [Flavicella sediminum]